MNFSKKLNYQISFKYAVSLDPVNILFVSVFMQPVVPIKVGRKTSIGGSPKSFGISTFVSPGSRYTEEYTMFKRCIVKRGNLFVWRNIWFTHLFRDGLTDNNNKHNKK